MRVVVDTNVWISALLNPSGFPASLLPYLEDPRVELLSSPALLDELFGVVARARFADRIAHDHLAQVHWLIAAVAEEVVPERARRRVRDESDDKVVATAITGRADAIVTRDSDFLGDPALIALLAEEGIEVLTVQRFLDRLPEGNP